MRDSVRQTVFGFVGLRPALTGAAILAGLALSACQERVVSAKGIGTERYVVKPDPAPKTTKKAIPTGPAPNPTGRPRATPSQSW